MDDIERIRHFNRFYTRKLGLFSRDYGGTGRSVTELRVFYEIEADEDRTARTIAQDLALDEGYVSRILQGYEREGWITRTPSDKDARRKTLRLTDAGRAVFDDLVRKARAETRERLNGSDPARVADALWAAMQAFAPEAPGAVAIREMAPGDAGWVVQRHAEIYAEDLGFDWRMEALVMNILSRFLPVNGTGGNRGFIAHRDGVRLGSIFCMATEDPAVAKLRLFLVEPAARGAGLGKRLMTACLDHARGAGFRRMTLMTHATQTTARAIYRHYGFRLVDSVPGRHFGRDSVEETWVADL